MANIAEHADKSIAERYRFNHAVVEFVFVFVFLSFFREEEEKPIVCASSPRQNLKSKRFRMKQEVSESKGFAGQEAKLLASIARLDEVVKRTNEINGGAFAKENELRRKEEEPKRAQPPQEEHALMRSIARLNLKLELTHETIQIHDEKLFRELLQIS